MNDEKIFHTTGAKRDKKDRRDYRIAGVTQIVEIPKQVFVLDEKFPSKNQLSRGSCTSQGQAHHKERQENKKMSARFIMALSKKLEGNTGYGGYTRNSFIVVNKTGVCSEELYPEPGAEMSWEEYIDASKISQQCYEDAKEHKSQSYWRVNEDFNEIKSALLQYKNSIVCSMEWFKEFNQPIDGLLPLNYSNSVGGHAVECCGWDDFKEVFTFKNSWGAGWSKGGFFYVPFSIFKNVIWDLWTSLDLPPELPVDKYYNEKRTWKDYLLEKKIAFNPWLIKKIGRLPTNREITALRFYWSFDAVFKGKVKDVWLKITKPEALKNGVIDKDENLVN